MDDDMQALLVQRAPTSERPLLGNTVLLVEDSRFACEAVRLLCLRSGARLRRADCIRAARRHLMTYRPSVVIIDLGLPDGSGLDLIREIAAMRPRVQAILGTSGDGVSADLARRAGADGFLPKPVESLAAFQQAVLAALPGATRRPCAVRLDDDAVAPDPLALRDDLTHAAAMLGEAPEEQRLGYLAQFIAGIARVSHDSPLEAAAADLAREFGAGRGTGLPISRINGLVRDRLAAGNTF